jgi:hypothetical protein
MAELTWSSVSLDGNGLSIIRFPGWWAAFFWIAQFSRICRFPTSRKHAKTGSSAFCLSRCAESGYDGFQFDDRISAHYGAPI